MDGEIMPDRLEAALGDGDPPVIVDIRRPAEFRRGHIPGSENLPLASLPGQVESLAGADHVVTVCPHGQSSVKAARLIAAYGEFDGRVESLAGGLEAWTGPLSHGEDEGDGEPAAESPF